MASAKGGLVTDTTKTILEMARAARRAARFVANASAETRTQALHSIAKALRDDCDSIIEANALDLANAAEKQLSAAMVDRLRLDRQRIESMASAVDSIAEAPNLVGRIERREVRPNGLRVARMRIPLGVIAMIYESRPNVTVDAAALCIKSGNAAILRGGSEAAASNWALGKAVATGLEAAGLPVTGVQVVQTTDRSAIDTLLTCESDIDLVIPRGGEGLIRAVTEKSRIPVLKHYKGVCHVYVHEAADLEMALKIAINAKAQRPGVCNAAETILVDRAVADNFIPILGAKFSELKVEVRGDERVVALDSAARPASESDWETEYLDRIVSVRVVEDFGQALEHIERFGSDHTEAIVTGEQKVAEEFLRLVNSSTVVVNASTRFADGGELGLGAEIGVSTTRLHAYGPMGAEGLTTTKFIVEGDGQIRQ